MRILASNPNSLKLEFRFRIDLQGNGGNWKSTVVFDSYGGRMTRSILGELERRRRSSQQEPHRSDKGDVRIRGVVYFEASSGGGNAGGGGGGGGLQGCCRSSYCT